MVNTNNMHSSIQEYKYGDGHDDAGHSEGDNTSNSGFRCQLARAGSLAACSFSESLREHLLSYVPLQLASETGSRAAEANSLLHSNKFILRSRVLSGLGLQGCRLSCDARMFALISDATMFQAAGRLDDDKCSCQQYESLKAIASCQYSMPFPGKSSTGVLRTADVQRRGVLRFDSVQESWL